jgi:hypothetical protein
MKNKGGAHTATKNPMVNKADLTLIVDFGSLLIHSFLWQQRSGPNLLNDLHL